MATTAPPEGPYIAVRSGEELENLLQNGSTAPMYLEMQNRTDFRVLFGLTPAASTVANIKCNGAQTIDTTAAQEYIPEPGTRLTFWSCNIHLSHSAPVAEETTFHNCNIFGVCKVLKHPFIQHLGAMLTHRLPECIFPAAACPVRLSL